MGILNRLAAPLAACLALAGCASSRLGFEPATGTLAAPTHLYRQTIGYKITCDRGMASCLRRAEAVCGGAYKIAGWPSRSPRVQALVDLRIVTVNTDNPKIIYIACG